MYTIAVIAACVKKMSELIMERADMAEEYPLHFSVTLAFGRGSEVTSLQSKLDSELETDPQSLENGFRQSATHFSNLARICVDLRAGRYSQKRDHG